jgi:hypothetical protein
MAYKALTSIAMGNHAPPVGEPEQGIKALFVQRGDKTALKVRPTHPAGRPAGPVPGHVVLFVTAGGRLVL